MRPVPSPSPRTHFLQEGPISLRFQDFSKRCLLWEAFHTQVIIASQTWEMRMVLVIFRAWILLLICSINMSGDKHWLEWENKTRDILPAIKQFTVGLIDDQATESSLVKAIDNSMCRTAKSISSLSVLVWPWLVTSGSCLGFPMLMDCNLETWSKISPFSSKLLSVTWFITVMNEAGTLPRSQWHGDFLVKSPWPHFRQSTFHSVCSDRWKLGYI